MKWYLAGPMSGIEDQNYPAFIEAAASLRATGHQIVSPHEVYHHPSEPDRSRWVTLLQRDLRALAECQGIILLPGWTKSKGAKFELHVALTLEMPVRFYRDGFAEEIS